MTGAKHSDEQALYAEYERLKREWLELHKYASPDEVTQALRAISDRLGV